MMEKFEDHKITEGQIDMTIEALGMGREDEMTLFDLLKRCSARPDYASAVVAAAARHELSRRKTEEAA